MGSRKKKFINSKPQKRSFITYYKTLSLEERIAIKAFYSFLWKDETY